jgi:hypothetical protein
MLDSLDFFRITKVDIGKYNEGVVSTYTGPAFRDITIHDVDGKTFTITLFANKTDPIMFDIK